ncbi:hypothetical protein J4G37_46970, partial [Microvirga sp. 3-52]|nr:hypothetical protein [Microvirga sp. 3-52]
SRHSKHAFRHSSYFVFMDSPPAIFAISDIFPLRDVLKLKRRNSLKNPYFPFIFFIEIETTSMNVFALVVSIEYSGI